MTSRAKLWTFVSLAGAAAFAVWWFAFRAGPSEIAAEPEPRALVSLAAAEKGSLSEQIDALGTVAADPASVATLAVERDVRITAIRVRPGDRVAAGDVLMTLGALAADKAQLSQAKSALAAAEQELARLRRLQAGGLASNDQVVAAEKAASDARAQLAALEQTGADGVDLKSPEGGVVLTIGGGIGQTLTAGSAAATIAQDSALIVTAGLEPEDALRVTPGLDANLISPLDGRTIESAKISAVGGAVDPATRFVNVTLKPAAVAGLMPGATLAIAIHLPSTEGVVVPRAALMEDGEGSYVYAIEDDTAHRVAVEVAFETSDKTLIASGLTGGKIIAVDGVASLADGMMVREATP